MYDFDGNIIQCTQQVRSEELEVLQSTDLLIEAMQFLNRDDVKSVAKTPYKRTLEKAEVDIYIKEKLTDMHGTLNPSLMIKKLKQLKHDIMSKNRKLMEELVGNLF